MKVMGSSTTSNTSPSSTSSSPTRHKSTSTTGASTSFSYYHLYDKDDDDEPGNNGDCNCTRNNMAYSDHGMSLLPTSSKKSTLDLMASLRTTLFRQVLLQRRRIKKTWGTIASCVAIVIVVIYLELSCSLVEKYFLETRFSSGFRYPSDIDNFPDVVKRFRDYEGNPMDFRPAVTNTIYSSIPFVSKAERTTSNPSGATGLLIVVKSAARNYKKRKAIRKTWGESNYLKQNVLSPELQTKLVFICGTLGLGGTDLLLEEAAVYGDIVLGDFKDTYGNNTLKTVLALRWAATEVWQFKYLMIVDDDMYVNLSNIISFVQSIPRELVTPVKSNDSGVVAYYPTDDSSEDSAGSVNNNYVSLKSHPFIMGQLIVDSKPFRNVIGFGSKWSVSVEEYQYNYFPPYIAGGVTLFDSSTVTDLYHASFFTKHFWIDDVYIGILAYKLGITLTHSNLMDSSYKAHLGPRLRDKFDKMLAFHGLECPEQLVELWNTLDIDALTDCYYISNNI